MLAWPEAELQSNVVALVKALRGRYFHVYDSRRSVPGYPDLHVWFPNCRHPVGLFRELKTERGRLSDEQAVIIEQFRACGYDVGVWRPRDWVSGRIQNELREAAR
ncbi:hypothetical protein BGP79_11810 [Tersicoccus sp. Bi-70]|nr:hypothetical protein BGP79_11810 [Tersicoccus sp. Bi-70]